MPYFPNMVIEQEGRKFEFIRGSDVINDGMYLEVWNDEEPKELMLFAFWSDADGSFTFTALQNNLPFALVERFIEVARQDLTEPQQHYNKMLNTSKYFEVGAIHENIEARA